MRTDSGQDEKESEVVFIEFAIYKRTREILRRKTRYRALYILSIDEIDRASMAELSTGDVWKYSSNKKCIFLISN